MGEEQVGKKSAEGRPTFLNATSIIQGSGTKQGILQTEPKLECPNATLVITVGA
jgi:hypothetical protein